MVEMPIHPVRSGTIKVYKFGVLWHWKCKITLAGKCNAGMRHRAWTDAIKDARAHLRMHQQEDKRFRLYPCKCCGFEHYNYYNPGGYCRHCKHVGCTTTGYPWYQMEPCKREDFIYHHAGNYLTRKET